MRPVDTIYLHHSASPSKTTTREDIFRWHVRQNGWTDIGYHKLVWPTGHIKQGRPDSETGAHAVGFNTGSFGVLAVGDYSREYPSMDLIEGLVYTCFVLCLRHGINPERIFGHRDVNATACPGEHLYPFIPYIRERVTKMLAEHKAKTRN